MDGFSENPLCFFGQKFSTGKKKRMLLSTSKSDGSQRANISETIREEMDMPDQVNFQYNINFKQKSIYVL